MSRCSARAVRGAAYWTLAAVVVASSMPSSSRNLRTYRRNKPSSESKRTSSPRFSPGSRARLRARFSRRSEVKHPGSGFHESRRFAPSGCRLTPKHSANPRSITGCRDVIGRIPCGNGGVPRSNGGEWVRPWPTQGASAIVEVGLRVSGARYCRVVMTVRCHPTDACGAVRSACAGALRWFDRAVFVAPAGLASASSLCERVTRNPYGPVSLRGSISLRAFQGKRMVHTGDSS